TMMTIHETDALAPAPTAVEAAVRLGAGNVVPLHPLADDQALAQIQNLAGSKINVSMLAKTWGWSRGKARRRIDAWKKAGQLAGGRSASRAATGRPGGRPTTPARAPAIGAASQAAALALSDLKAPGSLAAAASAGVTVERVTVLPPRRAAPLLGA